MTGEKLTDAELAKLAELEAAATPGPWVVEERSEIDDVVVCMAWYEPTDGWGWWDIDSTVLTPNDAAFIAAARSALPRLLAELAAERVALKAERAWRTTAGRLLVKVETMLLNQGFDARAEEIEALLGEQPPDSLPGVTRP